MLPAVTIIENTQRTNHILLAGWFSFEHGHATGGDILAMEVAVQWIQEAGFSSFDIAFALPFKGGVNWREVNPLIYSHVIFVCGPFEKNLYEAEFLSTFRHSKLIGLNLSMPIPLHQWNPFDLLYERNSSREVRPDMVFLSERAKVPVVGICLVETYPGAMDAEANIAIQRLINNKEAAVIYIDTRLDENSTNLRTAAEIETMIARVDLLVTTRLHGAVMAIKNGVPVVPIDPEKGGAKIVAQMTKIGWPLVFTADVLDEQKLSDAFDYCLTPEARERAKACYQYSVNELSITKKDFIRELNEKGALENTFLLRCEDTAIPAWAQQVIEQESDLSTGRDKEKLKKDLLRVGSLLLPGIVVAGLRKLKKIRR